MKQVWAVTLAAALTVMHPLAEAKRMGGGGSFGKQSSNVTQRQATPPVAPPARPAQQQNAQQQNNAAARPATPAAAPAKKPWGAMLGGLAAGLGLAWLANSLGFGEAFANMLMAGLIALAVMVVIGMIMRARANKKAATAGASASPFAFQGAGAPVAPEQVATPPQYKSHNVGNDASARPWEQIPGGAVAGSMIGSGIGATAANWDVPADFDAAGFLDAAKRNFVTLQAAWDKGDVATLRSMMTDGMLAEIQQQLQEREAESGGEPNQTDVVMIDGQLLGIEDVGDSYMASVEFSGLIREEPSAGPSPFREVWNMSKPKDNSSGWLVAGLQALS